MKTKFITSTVLSVLIVLFSSVGSAFAGWHDLTQSQRNQAIVSEANSWSIGSYGGACKIWVQTHIVWDASDSSVYLPTNNGTCSWNQDNDYIYTIPRCTVLDYVLPGEIIQMTLNSSYSYKPHTIVVTANNGSSITFRESNWCTNDCGLVGQRTLTYQEFYNMVICYTVYSIE